MRVSEQKPTRKDLVAFFGQQVALKTRKNIYIIASPKAQMSHAIFMVAPPQLPTFMALSITCLLAPKVPTSFALSRLDFRVCAACGLGDWVS